MSKLLTRDQFREAVFARDGHKCVFCDRPAVDAHHILERRLFRGADEQGGYFVDNGASVCEDHHLACERTDISVEEVREACGITKPVIPEHLYEDQTYDKWGNIILPNGTRLKGELFHDESVQKIIGNKLNLFSNRVKYPRSWHLPFSQNITDDDRVLKDMSSFVGKRIIVTAKLDGENTTFYDDGLLHARSIDGRNHPSRAWVKNFCASIAHDLPKDWRVCGENMYAVHSIKYDDLESYFYGFSIWDEKNVCLSWNETMEWFSLLGIVSVPVLYDGEYDEHVLRDLAKNNDWERNEGFVVRIADSFAYRDFSQSLAKWVRKNHVMTVKHWMYGQQIVSNGLKDS